MESYDALIESAHTKEQQPQRLSTEEWIAKKQEERAKAYDLIADMADKAFSDPEKLKQYLDVQARLGKTSVNNVLLAAAQLPNASYLQTFEEWQQRGRAVKANEKSIMQLYSRGEYEREDGTMGNSIDVKRVFDVSQTRGKPVNQRATLSMPMRSKIKALMTRTPVPVRLSDHVPQHALYDAHEREIKVARGLDGTAMFYAVARELAHADMAEKYPDDYEHHLYEFEADCAAYIACARTGVEAPPPAEIAYDLPAHETEYKKAVLNGIRDTACTINERVEQNLYAERQQQRNQPER